MNFNLNAGYGRLQTLGLPFLGSGKHFFVGKASLPNREMVTSLFGPDPDGKNRYFATVDEAIGACTANANDVIYVLPGHTETVTATSIALDVAGVQIIGLGVGALRPTFTFSTAAATITVTGASCAWKNCHFVANFADVAAAFTVGAAKDFVLEGNSFIDSSLILNFLSVLVTGSTNNEADGLTIVNNYWYSLATTANAFVSILANELRVLITDNIVDKAATNDAGQFITLSSKVVGGIRILRNVLTVVGNASAAVGIFLTGSGTTSSGIAAYNLVSSLDTTGALIATAGTGIAWIENYLTGAADKSGAVWPVADNPA
jgi:hypothetical protein